MKSFLPMTGALQGSLDLLLKALKVMDSWAWPQPRLTWSSCTHWWVLEVVARSLDPSLDADTHFEQQNFQSQ